MKTILGGQGIVAKKINGPWIVQDHVLYGTTDQAWNKDPWISTTTDFLVAQHFNEERNSYYGIVAIDLNKVLNEKVFTWGKGILNDNARKYLWQKEVSIRNSIPQSAIVGYVP
ncbi:hypothetical protein [uncultured Brevibacillus sp.]|uniref:DUF7587 domain-containing protein n=1 Tax=uncultured Brevibacillus sp. TaxID=169970 RepID=UPI00259A672D|nr:hypothetical protein [uncultured Brevibacillus sp.]